MSNKNSTLVLWDADGVLVDTRQIAWEAAGQILGAFGIEFSVNCQEDYRKAFGVGGNSPFFSERECKTAREMHRSLMRRLAPKALRHEGVLEVIRSAPHDAVIVTSAYSETIRIILDSEVKLFTAVLGQELGGKRDILRAFATDSTRLSLGITDTITDVKRYREIGVRPVAVTWGYDTVEAFSDDTSIQLAKNPTDLRNILTDFLQIIQ